MNNIAILMATYNGAAYIKKQINSFIDQTYENWDLYISDDGSKDNTLSLLAEYNDARIRPVIQHESDHGAFTNFYGLLRFAKEELLVHYDYFFLSDQDDIWDKEKIEKYIQIFEKENNKNLPILVYSDLRIIDEDDICSSKMSDLYNIKLDKPVDVFFNPIYVWGNTIAFNKRMLEMLTLPSVLDNHFSHDQYLAYNAAAFGKVEYVDEPLTLYRRFNNNVSDLGGLYGKAGALKRLLTKFSEVRKGHEDIYNNVVKFIETAPIETEMLDDIKRAYLRGGLSALRVIHNYKPVMGISFYNKAANFVILLFKLYKISMDEVEK